MQLGTCNMISPYKVGIKTVAREVAKYKLDLVGYRWLGAVCTKKFQFDKNFSVMHLRNWVQQMVED